MDLDQALEAIAQLRAYPLTVAPDSLDGFLREIGFVRTESESGDWVYSHPRGGYPITIPAGAGPLLPAYVYIAADAIEEVITNGD
jgi:hypothetical protein